MYADYATTLECSGNLMRPWTNKVMGDFKPGLVVIAGASKMTAADKLIIEFGQKEQY